LTGHTPWREHTERYSRGSRSHEQSAAHLHTAHAHVQDPDPERAAPASCRAWPAKQRGTRPTALWHWDVPVRLDAGAAADPRARRGGISHAQRRRRCVDRQPNLAGDDRVESGV